MRPSAEPGQALVLRLHTTSPARQQGFITAEAGPKGNVSILQLPPGVRLDAPWPLFKVAQQAQPHRLTFYPEARLYALTVSRQVCWHRRAQALLAGRSG